MCLRSSEVRSERRRDALLFAPYATALLLEPASLQARPTAVLPAARFILPQRCRPSLRLLLGRLPVRVLASAGHGGVPSSQRRPSVVQLAFLQLVEPPSAPLLEETSLARRAPLADPPPAPSARPTTSPRHIRHPGPPPQHQRRHSNSYLRQELPQCTAFSLEAGEEQREQHSPVHRRVPGLRRRSGEALTIVLAAGTARDCAQH